VGSRSPEQQIESIVRSLEERGVPAAPVEAATGLATSHPEAVSDLAVAVMRRFPKGGTFLDGTLSFLPQEGWPELVRVALDALERPGKKNEAAESVIEYASLQCPTALHPHRDRIFRIRPNARCYYECYPWRESGEAHLDCLRTVIEDTTSTEQDRTRAWRALCETRHPKAIEFALSCADRVAPPDWSLEEWVQAHLHLVGLHRESASVRRTCPESLYHLQFPEAFFDPQSRPPWLARIHPTWRLPESAQAVPFGGHSAGRCSLCGGTLHRLLVLDPVPAGLGITRLTRLELAICLSCLGWERQPLFYRHGDDGSPVNVGYDGPAVSPQFPVGPLRESEVGLARTPRRWFWQDSGCSNSRENLNRVGGEPCWVQDAKYPRCPSCDKAMDYLLQLDSDLPTADGGEWLWGSGGTAYGFWCNECRVSGVFWQCT
jgi:hypothetical protein